MSWRSCPLQGPAACNGRGRSIIDRGQSTRGQPQLSTSAHDRRSLVKSDQPSWRTPALSGELRAPGNSTSSKSTVRHQKSKIGRSPKPPPCVATRSWCKPPLQSLEPPQLEDRDAKRSRSWLTTPLDAAVSVGRSSNPTKCTSHRKCSFTADHTVFLNQMKHKDLDEYDKNSVDISRIRSVIKNGCTCQARCTADFDPLSIQRVCTAYCSLEHGERQFFLHTLYHSDSEGLRDTSAPSCDMEATARKTRWHLLGQKVCVKGFAALLGMAPRTLYKQVSQALDTRRAIGDAGRLAERRDAPQR